MTGYNHAYGYLFGGNPDAPEPMIQEEYATFKNYADFCVRVKEIVGMFGLNGTEREYPGDPEKDYTVDEITTWLPDLWEEHKRRQRSEGKRATTPR